MYYYFCNSNMLLETALDKNNLYSSLYYWTGSVSFFHLISNIAGLYIIYKLYESNEFIFYIVFLFTVYFSGLLMIFIFPEERIVGSSAGIMGVYSFVVMIEIISNPKKKEPYIVHGIVLIIFAYFSYQINRLANIKISHHAHLLGFLSGFIIFGWFQALHMIIQKIKNKQKQK